MFSRLTSIFPFWLLLLGFFSSCLIQGQSGKQSVPVAIVDNSIEDTDQISDDRYGNVLGVIDWEEKVRVYFQNRGHDRAEYSESDDLITWSEPKPVMMDINMFLFNDGDKIRCYRNDGGGDLVLYSQFHPVEGCQKREGIAYNWKLDGQVSMNVVNGKYISTGRVRGTSSKKEGGWGNDIPPHPRVENYPNVIEAFELYSCYDAEDFLKDRRGISIHKSENGEQWESSILADPAEVNIKGFRGWTSDKDDGIADFYSSTLVDEEKILIKVFWKEKDRLIDRSEYSDQFKENVRRRYRFTGETTIIPGVIRNGKLEITSTESVIPIDTFKRVVSDEVYWASAPEREEVGQFTLANRVLKKNDHVYLFFQYRDDIHYEFHESMQYSGIFIHRIKREEFNSLFEQGL